MTLTTRFQAVEQHVMTLLYRVRSIETQVQALAEGQKKLPALMEEKSMLLEMIEEGRKFLRTETARMSAEGHNHFSGALDPEDHPKVAHEVSQDGQK